MRSGKIDSLSIEELDSVYLGYRGNSDMQTAVHAKSLDIIPAHRKRVDRRSRMFTPTVMSPQMMDLRIILDDG